MKSAPKRSAAQPAPLDGMTMRERLRGLNAAQAAQLRDVMSDLGRGDVMMAGVRLLALAGSAPDHPEVLRWRGSTHLAAGEWARAADCFSRAAALRSGDFAVLIPLATAQDLAGDPAAAMRTLQAAFDAAAGSAEWFALSVECDRQGRLDLALWAVDRALASGTQSPVALLQRARCLHALGDAASAAADCRTLIATDQLAARAWFTLLDLKVVPLSPAELAQLEAEAAAKRHGHAEHQLLNFALGKALEDAGRHEAALAAFHAGNAVTRALHPWDATAFGRHVDDVRNAFAEGRHASAHAQGAEVIFLVGLPRSGTTLVEQVLASHSRVEGASELPYLSQVVEEESRRRGRRFPAWVDSASVDDWTRLGQRYLQLSARWRERRPIATDKLPENWLLAGAALAMLPQARVIDCRRDPVETCWSCYKQLFAPQRVGFTYGFETLAAYWHACDALCRFWAQREPGRIRAQSYEALVAAPEAEIRALLDFCGLDFEPACLQFHTAARAIRTPSALQVRQPLTRVSTAAAGYGELLHPLRRLLAEPAADGA